jgi:hypothetical protein
MPRGRACKARGAAAAANAAAAAEAGQLPTAVALRPAPPAAFFAFAFLALKYVKHVRR